MNTYPNYLRIVDETLEGFCSTCNSLTQNYDNDGCCRYCGTTVEKFEEVEIC